MIGLRFPQFDGISEAGGPTRSLTRRRFEFRQEPSLSYEKKSPQCETVNVSRLPITTCGGGHGE